MRYPNIGDYIRFYKYSGIWHMVLMRNPAKTNYLLIYVDHEKYGLSIKDRKSIAGYNVYNYSDWVQCIEPPKYIDKSQKFNWYRKYWEKHK